jgi:AI-2 transport protein TqsA
MLQQESYWFWAAVVLIPGTVQFVVGNVLEPKMVGENLDLHPVTTVLVLMFWGLIWGVPGMFLAVPLTVVIRIFLDSSEGGKKISEIMAGRFSPQA